MKLIYLSTARIPDDWGHVVQIMKMCEAFAEAGHDVTLLVPHRATTRANDPFAYVGAKPVFRIQKLPCIDILAGSEGKFWYWLRTLSFFLFAKCYLSYTRYDLLYTREPLAPFFLKARVPPPRAGATPLPST